LAGTQTQSPAEFLAGWPDQVITHGAVEHSAECFSGVGTIGPGSMKPMIFRTLFLNTALIVPGLRRITAMAVESNHELSVGKP
jgi:hypothetical protein